MNPSSDQNKDQNKRVKIHRTTGSAPVLSNNGVQEQPSQTVGFSASYNTSPNQAFLEPMTPRVNMGVNLSSLSQEQNRTHSPQTTPSNVGPKKCYFCKTVSTPEWRRGPTGPKSLCNACGLRYSRRQKSIQGAEEEKN